MRNILLLSCVLTAACGPSVQETQTYAVRSLDLSRATDGVSPGFDLDGRNSDEGDLKSCAKSDYVDPLGGPGVDNGLAEFVPLIEWAAGGDLEAVIRESINDGRLLVLFEVQRWSDGRVDLAIRRASGTPSIGSDGFLAPKQSFAPQPDGLLTEIEGVSLSETALAAGPFRGNFVLFLLGQPFSVVLESSRIGIDVTTGRGVLGGSVTVEQLQQIVLDVAEDTGDDLSFIANMLPDFADMSADETGACRAVSLGLTFELVPAATRTE